jgi:hypothetical protein
VTNNGGEQGDMDADSQTRNDTPRQVSGGRWRHRGLLVVVPVALVCGGLAGCSGSPTSSTGGPSPTGSTVKSSASTPLAPQNRTGAPTAFKTTGIPLPAAVDSLSSERPYPIAVSGYTVFVSLGTSSEVIDAATGETAGVVRVRHTIAQPTDSAELGVNPEAVGDTGTAPVIVDQQGQQVAIFGYLVSLPGHGTTPPSLAVELDAVTTSGTLRWSMTTPTRAQLSLIDETPILTFVGVSGDDAIATVGDDEDGYSTYAFDIASRTIAWVNDQFLAQTVVGGTVVGTYDTSAPSSGSLGDSDTANHIEAVSAATGKTTWQQTESVTAADIQQASPSTIMTEAIDSRSGNNVIWLLHLNTGHGSEIYNQPSEVHGAIPFTCEFDDGTAVVCTDSDTQAAFGVNGTTGKELWLLPDKSENRVAPNVAAVFDGDVYGSTQSGPVVLNAVTGADVNDSPGVDPVLLDSDLGIAKDENDLLEAYLATS